MCRNILFKEVMLSLLVDMSVPLEIFDSTASDVNGLLEEISHINPDMILLEETSPLSKGSCLFDVLAIRPGCPVVVVSQEHNQVHIVKWQTVQLNSASDLINTIGFD